MSRPAGHRSRIASGLLLLACLGMIACESVPVRAMRGARYYVQGSEALERGDWTRAIADLKQAAELVPQGSEIQNHLGLAYWAAGQPKQAGNAFDRALAIDCSNQAARTNRDRLAAAWTAAVSEPNFGQSLDSSQLGIDDSEDQKGTRHGG